MNKPSGSNFLKVTGILMIIGGALGIITAIIALLGVAALISLGVNSVLLILASLLALAGAVAELVAGIVGVTNCNDPSKAKTCMTWGIIVIGVSVVSSILSVVAGGSFPMTSFLLGLIIPVLYIIGAVKNQQG